MSEAAVLTLIKARSELGALALEHHIADALSLPKSKVTVIIEEGDTTIITYDDTLDADAVARKINDTIQRGDADAWVTTRDAMCEVADDEESVLIDEEEALGIWRELSEEARTGHLDRVPNPDGIMIQPTNDSNFATKCTSPTELQLRRDPALLEYDNVKRIDVSQINNASWEEPFIITSAMADEVFRNSNLLDKNQLCSIHGGVEVRTGNRETLIDNGITNSKPMVLSEALSTPQSGEGNIFECGRIVFSPVKELPHEFSNQLKMFTDCFPLDIPMNKYTLTLASEGFGIGMHKHNEAMFMLLVGRKKWYMCSSEHLEDDGHTHPGFYKEKSTHKCIQKPGEILFVPREWYHEIFNLEYTAGVQALPN